MFFNRAIKVKRKLQCFKAVLGLRLSGSVNNDEGLTVYGCCQGNSLSLK